MWEMQFSSIWDFEAFTDYLHRKGLHEYVISTVISNRINSELFLSLMEGDLKELALAIGDRLCLRKILEEACKVISYYILIGNFISSLY